MTILASDIFRRVLTILQDANAVRWPYPELREWLNDGLMEIALQKPSATSKTVILSLIEGTYQPVPAGYVSLISVLRNLRDDTEPRKGGAAISAVNREMMDAQLIGWHDPDVVPYQTAAVHVIADPADPKVFYVYPGNDGTGFVEATLSAIPAQILPPDAPEASDIPRFDIYGNLIPEVDVVTDPSLEASYQLAVDIADIYRSALVDYIVYRSFTKDTQYGGAAQRAGTHYQLFQGALGIKQQGEMVANVNTTHKIPAA